MALAFKVPGIRPDPTSGVLWAGATPDALALTVLAAVLDGYEGARLDRALTRPQDRVADNAGAHYGATARGPVTFMLSGVPAQGKSAADVETALRAEVQRVAAEGISPAELDRVINQWSASAVYQQDSVFNQARMLGANWTTGLPTDFDEQLLERLRTVTPAQVQAVAARYFGNDDLTVATLIPQALDPMRRARAALPGVRH